MAFFVISQRRPRIPIRMPVNTTARSEISGASSASLPGPRRYPALRTQHRPNICRAETSSSVGTQFWLTPCQSRRFPTSSGMRVCDQS